LRLLFHHLREFQFGLDIALSRFSSGLCGGFHCFLCVTTKGRYVHAFTYVNKGDLLRRNHQVKQFSESPNQRDGTWGCEGNSGIGFPKRDLPISTHSRLTSLMDIRSELPNLKAC
jgi:hypothetical protein